METRGSIKNVIHEIEIDDMDLPGWNQCIAYAKMGHRGSVYASKKKYYTKAMCDQLHNKIPYMFEYLEIELEWYKAKRNKDPDNIASGVKFILDALIKENVIINDGWKQIKKITHTFNFSKENKIKITICGKLTS